MLIKQHDQTDCAAACLASIAARYKLLLPIAKIRQYASTNERGTSFLGLIAAANKMGFEARGVKGNLDSLKKIPLPAIAHVAFDKVLYHYVVIYKCDHANVLVMDPSDGKMHRLSVVDFAKNWTGALLLMSPNEAFNIGNYKTTNSARFWHLIKPHQSVFIQTLFGSLIYTTLGLCTAIFVQKITDYVLGNGNRNLLNLMGMMMIVILLVRILIGTIKSIFTLRTGQQIDANLILGYHTHLLKLPQQFFDTMRVGEIISRVNDAVKIRILINDISANLVMNVLIVFFSFAIMFTYYWKLALVMSIFVPFYLLIYLIINIINKRIQRNLMIESAELESQLVEAISTVGTIKKLGLEEFINNKTEMQFVKLLDTAYKAGKSVIISNATVELISQLLVIMLLWVGTGYVLAGRITPGEMFSFYTLTGYFTGPVASLISANKDIQEALSAADRLYEIIDLEIQDERGSIVLTPILIGDIRFENVSFSYENHANIFNDLNLNIKPGSFTALVGKSGSGKSTLVTLLQNSYPLQEGNIFIGKYPIKYLTNESLRRMLCIVPQKVDLFTGNIIDNIAIGVDEPDMQRIVDICMELDMIKFIENLPKGFQTYLGENGAILSGGQKQRIAIARALYRKPEILILDEATSSLDSASERFVQRTMELLVKQHKTIIVIAHRLTTIQHASHIMVLDNGKIVEEGTHQEMLSTKGHYHSLWKQQFGYVKYERPDQDPAFQKS